MSTSEPEPPAHPAVPSARLAVFYFVYLAALGAFSPYFPLYLDDRGLSAAAISGVMSLWYGTRIVSPLVWGRLTVEATTPVRWLRIAAFATLVCFAGFLLPLPVAGIVVVMAGFSFFYNAVMPQFDAITLSHLRQEPHRYGRIRLWGSVGFLATALGLGGAFERIGIQWLPAVMLPLFALLLASSFTNDYGATHPASGRRESIIGSLRRAGVVPFIACAFLMQVAHGPYYVFFSLFLDENGYRPAALGAFWAVGVAAEIAMFWFAAGLLARFGAVRLMRVCLAVAAVRFVATGLLPGSLAVMTVAQLSHAFTFGLFHSALIHRIARLFPGRAQDQGQGLLYGLGSGLGGVAGSLLAGWAWTQGGGKLAFLIAGASALVGLAVAWTMQPGDPSSRPRDLPLATDEAL
jgi:PPP family 3-phenylpropionic acid transporter